MATYKQLNTHSFTMNLQGEKKDFSIPANGIWTYESDKIRKQIIKKALKRPILLS